MARCVSICWAVAWRSSASDSARSRSNSAALSTASSRASCASVCRRLTSYARGSILARRSPASTGCPSANVTSRSSPSTRLRTVTVLDATTVPSPLRNRSMSPSRASTAVTGTTRRGGALGAGAFASTSARAFSMRVGSCHTAAATPPPSSNQNPHAKARPRRTRATGRGGGTTGAGMVAGSVFIGHSSYTGPPVS